MKGKRFWNIRLVDVLLIASGLLLLVLLFFANRILFYVAAPVMLGAVGYALFRLLRIQADLRRILTQVGESVTGTGRTGLIRSPMPSLLVSREGEILWYNQAFRQQVLSDTSDRVGESFDSLLGRTPADLLSEQGGSVTFWDRCFKVHGIENRVDGKTVTLFYFTDVTELEEIRLKAQRERPAVMHIMIDNYDEAIGSDNDGQQIRLAGEVQATLREFADTTGGILRKLSHDRFSLVLEQQALDQVIATRFDVLNRVRGLTPAGRLPVTLSIGVGRVTAGFAAAERTAREALHMALGRGGDQAAIHTDNGYSFFGGISRGTEKRTKVRSRMIAEALRELIGTADRVLVMGHKFADLDSMGASMGMVRICECLHKPVQLVLDLNRNLSQGLVERMNEAGRGHLFVSPELAAEQVDEQTLLIVVDTHTANLVESKTLYEKSRQVVIIDHHRKMVEHIDNAVIFFHEPSASSASEMVTELAQYMGDECRITPLEAEALLAGITLDTKNFVMKTGVRTFEAAAYLRRMGADTVEVRRQFSSTMEAYQQRSRLVSSAEIYNGCAVAVSDFQSPSLRVVAPQAADELLNITGVRASFVLSEQDGRVCISARSMGGMNVQTVMEDMGGGGHHTMAAAQLSHTTLEEVRQQLIAVIDRHLALLQE